MTPNLSLHDPAFVGRVGTVGEVTSLSYANTDETGTVRKSFNGATGEYHAVAMESDSSVAAANIRYLKFRMLRSAGATGSVYAKVWDNGQSPYTTLKTSSAVNVTTLTTDSEGADVTFDFGSCYALTASDAELCVGLMYDGPDAAKYCMVRLEQTTGTETGWSGGVVCIITGDTHFTLCDTDVNKLTATYDSSVGSSCS